MGILGRLRTMIFRSPSNIVKEVLTVASSNVADTTSISVVKEPTSPHHGAIYSTSDRFMEQNPQEFFASDFEKALYDDEETMMGSMLLLHTSNFSSMSGAELGESHDEQTCLSSGSEVDLYPRTSADQQLEIQTAMEPSFEVALMESIAPDSGSQYKDPEAPRAKAQSWRAMSAEEVMMDLDKDMLATCLLPRRKRYDHDGRAFIHIYNERLSTLNESPSFLEEASPRTPRSSIMTIQLCGSEDQKLQKRWELAKYEFEQDGKEIKSPSPRSPSHSRRTRMWLKAIILP